MEQTIIFFTFLLISIVVIENHPLSYKSVVIIAAQGQGNLYQNENTLYTFIHSYHTPAFLYLFIVINSPTNDTISANMILLRKRFCKSSLWQMRIYKISPPKVTAHIANTKISIRLHHLLNLISFIRNPPFYASYCTSASPNTLYSSVLSRTSLPVARYFLLN